jgi:pyruvate dehydrogenase phosphatase
VKAALREAARKREMRLADLQKIEQGTRRHFHDDITVIVVFLNHKLIDNSSLWGSSLSIKGGGSANH